jgi:cellulose biosynthesis protein BcsQ
MLPQTESPLTISVVSGKGGVGKTMLTMAIARELSVKNRTLLFDLDFFNRGLTGLLRTGKTVGVVEPPGFVSPGEGDEERKWELVEVAPNLIHVRYPDLNLEQIQHLEELQVRALGTFLSDFLQELRRAAKCDVIVMDCHGGPDRLSFAACMASDYTLLVSEPDRITFYGTLHFVRQLEAALPEGWERQVDLRLVLNKVVPAFSGFYLRRFYNRELRPIFHGRPLLGIFPIEMYLTKEFERTPFLTEVYPFSLLARKTRLLLRDLLTERHRSRLPRAARRLGWLHRALLQAYIGKDPWFFDLSKVMATIAIVSVSITGIYRYSRVAVPRNKVAIEAAIRLEIMHALRAGKKPPRDCADIPDRAKLVDCTRQDPYWLSGTVGEWSDENLPYAIIGSRDLVDPALRSDKDPYVQEKYRELAAMPFLDQFAIVLYHFASRRGELLGMAGGIWLLSVVLLRWSFGLDRSFAYSCRAHHSILAFAGLGLMAAMWFLPIFGAASLLRSSGRGDPTLGWGLLLPAALWIVVQWQRTFFNVWYERRFVEASARVLSVACMAAFFAYGYWS